MEGSRFSVKKSSSPGRKQDKTNLISDSQDDEINTSNYYGAVIVQNGKKSGIKVNFDFQEES